MLSQPLNFSRFLQPAAFVTARSSHVESNTLRVSPVLQIGWKLLKIIPLGAADYETLFVNFSCLTDECLEGSFHLRERTHFVIYRALNLVL